MRLGVVVWLASAVLARASADSQPLSIQLETAWPAVPIALEILETAHDENPSSYLPLLRLLTTLPPSLSDRDILASAKDLISSHSLLPETSLATFDYALGLHSASPKVEAFFSWYDNHEWFDSAGAKEGCGSWVEWRGKGFCTAGDLRRDMEMSIEDGDHHLNPSAIHFLPFDHHSHPDDRPSQAVFYYDVADVVDSGVLLGYLDHHAAQDPAFGYIVRYAPPTGRDVEKKTALSGYGVEMVLKKTDYLVVDDRAPTSGQVEEQVPLSHADGDSSKESIFGDVLGEDPWAELANPLQRFEVGSLGVFASALIKSHPSPLDALLHLAEDFPKYSAAVARRVDVPRGIARRVDQLAHRGQATPSLIINGRSFKDGEINAFSLLNVLREERDHILSLVSLGLTPKQAFELLTDPLIGQAQVEDDPTEGLVDASDREEGGGIITYWNDIEKDKRYAQWPKSMQGFVRPTYPGQFHPIRRNVWNLVFVLDLSLGPSLDIMASSISAMIQRNVPLRFGVVPMVTPGEEDLSRQMARLFLYSVKNLGRGATRDMFIEILKVTPSTPSSPGKVKLDTAERAYRWISAQLDKELLPFEQVIRLSELDEQLAKVESYMTRLSATREDSPVGHLFINGKHTPCGGHWAQVVQNELQNLLGFLQGAIINKVDMEDPAHFFYDLPSTSKSRNTLIVPSQPENKLRAFSLPDLFAQDATRKLNNNFVYSDPYIHAPITTWVIADLDSRQGHATVRSAIENLQNPLNLARVGFVHVPSKETSSASDGLRLSTIIYQLIATSQLNSLTPGQFLELLDAVESVGNGEEEIFANSPLHAFSSGGWSVADEAAAGRFWEIGTSISKKLKLRSVSPHLLVNGRLVGPINGKPFTAGDFQSLATYEYRKRNKAVIDVVMTMYDNINAFDRHTLANLVASISSIVTVAYLPPGNEGIFQPEPAPRSRWYEQLDDGAMSFSQGDEDTALLRVAAVLDPISETAQKWAPLLKALSSMTHVAVSVYLEPDLATTDLKLKRFYRSSIASGPQFDVDGNSIAPPVTFIDLPASPIFTLGLDIPPAWIVSPKTSPLDLDNLLISSLSGPTSVLFELKQLLIEGHAREASNAPPRGLQLHLTERGLEVSDTLVMANLGYLQFKVTPGVYDLSIRPGRGQEVFELESVGNDGWDSLGVNVTGTEVTLTSFEGMTILPRFVRRPGMDTADVLTERDPLADTSYAGAVLSKMKEIIGLKDEHKAVEKTRHADINIFTVASGLLYERFASIMVLSVMKHTTSTVKFWFIENFLSPTFLAFLPHLAKEYGFEYELVTYKWPSWLRAQTEKQRIIWAYKILFLDVLFPMDLDKVIFVDADQIVRTDMKELVDVDLHGRVYGYAPMGDDREEMEGFRFWKTGYWKEALRGRPYHISALYVVDLKRFRQLATGDRLRGQYHALSADPNSLANLDQDLPNSMQDTIPIFTLDQDWLWCQTWCSDESLARAKTIDLCQNPLTKEPKLVRARQIPEWDAYDREIAALAARVEGAGGALAASVDDLAADKSGGGIVSEDEGEDHEDLGTSDAASELEKEAEEVEEEETGQSRRIEDEL